MNNTEYRELVGRQRAYFGTGATMPLVARLENLRQLRQALRRWETAILSALKTDLGKSTIEGYSSEIGVVLSEIDYAMRNLRKWMKPVKCKGPWMAWPSKGTITREPLGVALILAPWNYPVQLLLSPLIGAIAAGNCAVVKPSEVSPRTAEVMAGMIRETFNEEYVACKLGGPEAAEGLLEQRFDTIFYTGSTGIGRRVMEAAAKHLTPVTLELGGKCPCVVTSDTRIDVAAKRIIWAKMMNAGQTCVAPDYVYVEETVREPFLAACKKAIETSFGADPRQSPDYGRIVNRKHFARLAEYLSQGVHYAGGACDEAELYVAPTLMSDVPPTAGVMQEEIFGPILPVLAFHDVEEVFTDLKNRPAPLAVYLFAQDRALVERVMRELPAGSVCVNDVMMQMLGKQLPFGGVGASGMGRYHGRASFDCFSYPKTLLHCSTRFDAPFRYPPPQLTLDKLRRVLKFLLNR